jgi:tartrate-resistant acid phosphatase type 5
MKGRRAASALLAASALACGSCRDAPTPFTLRNALPSGAELALPPLASPVLRVLLVGDMGDDTRQQGEVARAIAAAHARAPFDLALHVGDNLYECGPDVRLPGADRCAFSPDGNTVADGYAPPHDPGFEAKLEHALAPLARGSTPVPVYLALGNHDVAADGLCTVRGIDAPTLARRRACLEVAHASALWRMPARHYVLDRDPARFLVIDSNLLVGDYGGFTIDGEIEFVRSAAAGCAARPCFVVAHHPAVTAAEHRSDATPEYVARVRRLEEAAGGRIAAWLAGHDHDLQHLRAVAGYDVLVSGNGSRERPGERFERVSVPGAQLLFASTARGFASLEVARDGWLVRFEATSGEPLHCCRATFPGACQPVACRASSLRDSPRPGPL